MTENPNTTPDPAAEPTAALRTLVLSRNNQERAITAVDDEIAKLDAKRDERWAFREGLVTLLEEYEDAIDTLRDMAAAKKQYEETL